MARVGSINRLPSPREAGEGADLVTLHRSLRGRPMSSTDGRGIARTGHEDRGPPSSGTVVKGRLLLGARGVAVGRRGVLGAGGDRARSGITMT